MKKYCNGTRLRINIKDNKIVSLIGLFYDKGDSWNPTEKNLTNEVKHVIQIRIQNPNMIQVFGESCGIYIEYFDELIITKDGYIIVEI